VISLLRDIAPHSRLKSVLGLGLPRRHLLDVGEISHASFLIEIDLHVVGACISFGRRLNRAFKVFLLFYELKRNE
jgi:hypothetical protein